jgi:tricorn protease
MLRYPDISATHIVFVYANDLWVAPREGGMAVPLASPPGQELNPKFSADGQTIAFVGNYDGNRDLYATPLAGGIPMRITHHPAGESLCDWTPDGKLLYATNGFAPLSRQTQLLVVSPAGGLPNLCPVPYGTNGAISPDGRWLAYTPHSIDNRTWKRYRGGMATDIWLFDLQTKQAQKITDWEGLDSLPMWHAQKVIYLSDAGPEHKLNLWQFDTQTGAREQLTTLSEFDVKWPSIGPGDQGQGEVIFQYGPWLVALDLATRATRNIYVSVPGALETIRPRQQDVSRNIAQWDISPSGKRAVVEARGDIWTLPASSGPARNLTRTSGVAERDPSWSPDGKWIAYFSDATGEYELYITQSDGKGETRQLTKDSKTYYYEPTWSPDSKHIAFIDKAGTIYLHTLEGSKTVPVDRNPFAERGRLSWSPNSAWIAYSKTGDNRTMSIWLYEVAAGRAHQVTSGMFSDTWPVFSRDAKYLFFASNRSFNRAVYDDIGTNFIYTETDMLLGVPLREGVANPWTPTSDEESFSGRPSPPQPETSNNYIDLAGFEQRAFAIPVASGSFTHLDTTPSGGLVYVRGASRGAGGNSSIKYYDLRARSEATLLDNAGSFKMAADGRKLITRTSQGGLAMMSAATGQSPSNVPTSGMTALIDPRQEWQQLFTEAWRIQRDFFYDPYMHGVDWPAIRERYQRLLADCTAREDVSFVIGEMISELNVGHAYVRGDGDVESPPSVAVGMLGCDYELHEGAYRIVKIHEGAAWDVDARNPLRAPNANVKEGEYLLAVNGLPVDASKDPWAAFQNLSGKVTLLTISSKPKLDESAREVAVVPLSSESTLRYRGWIERNRKFVEEKTGGQVGYIFVPDTQTNGQSELVRQFFGQRHKPALIIDERWNSGGQIPTRFIELLNRPVTNYWARRDGKDWTWPPDAHQGPKCMLINGLSGSGGDAFPAYFRQAGLGKLVGTRTWGGLVGISGNPSLIDGGYISAPTFAFYEKDGTWGIEGHGVDPDVHVIDDPAQMQNGADPQLAAAIELMLQELQTRPYTPPPRPKYPDRSNFGIRDEDK